ncbi:MAG TPA: penicillin-binding protein 1C [Burkholderiaceae bacterium]|nr:penicillin-binding protein 1C [Burkholderiaceae bacterium]
MTPRAALLGAVFAIASSAHALPTFADVHAAHRPSDLTLLDRRGEAIQTLRIDKNVRRLAWVPLAEMSPALLQAIVLSEDRRFYEHSGVDWGAMARSAWGNVWNTRTRGASTLTMQLAGLIDDGLARPSGGRSVTQKLGQVAVAAQLEARWKKSEILEAYLNSVTYRGEIVGIDALAQTLFGKRASGLDPQEAAIAAALVRGPNAKPDVVAQRACGVLRLQAPGDDKVCTGVNAHTETALARKGGMVLGEQIAPHFARQLVASAGLVDTRQQRSTLDARLQRFANAQLRRQIAELADRNVEDGAVIVLDNRSGEVLAWVGSSGDLSGAAQVDGVLARRQPGSTLKPFVYELAFERRLVTPASLIDDSPAQIATANGLYLPQNYDHDFKGWVSARTALGASLNVPAVRVGAMLGPDALVERFNALGLALPQSGGYYGNALALGAADVSLLGLANAYRTLANGGLHSPIAPFGLSLSKPASTAISASTGSARTEGRAGAGLRVADPAAVFLTTDILADNNARARTFGLTSLLATRGFAAVKTGTSKDMRDNWCVGFTDRYTVGVWVGNASGAAMHGVSGVSGAAPVWQAIVNRLHEGSPSKAPAAPVGVVATRVAFDAQREPARDEWFIAGTEQAQQRASAQLDASPQRFGITSPRDGSVFAVDPDMPAAVQRITFEGEHGTWVLDGKRLGAGQRLAWAPWPGRHELALLTRDGSTLQTVRFEVRGAGVKVQRRSR